MSVCSKLSRNTCHLRAHALGSHDTIDFVVVLLGYARSFEATLQSFYERLAPFAAVFMALFGRHHLPSRSALSRFLAALDTKLPPPARFFRQGCAGLVSA